MTRTSITFTFTAFLLAAPLMAQPATTNTAHTTTAAANDSGVSSEELRLDFSRVVDHYPPEVRKVLRLDPTLLSNPTYLATYPELLEFVTQHPAIVHSPRYFLGSAEELPVDTAGIRMWRSIMEAIGLFSFAGLGAFILTWVVRTIIDHRRWSRLSKMQADVHSRLIERFTSNEELLAYIQTPAGARFLESAPIQLDSPRQISAPLGRILWSVQSGLVLAAAGVGFQLVSSRVEKDLAEPLVAIGILGIAIGAGFVISAVVSFFLSRQLGLIAKAEAE